MIKAFCSSDPTLAGLRMLSSVIQVSVLISSVRVICACICKIVKATTSFIMSVSLSTSTILAPTGQIFMKFEYFSKVFQENTSFIKTGQELWVFYMKTNIHF